MSGALAPTSPSPSLAQRVHAPIGAVKAARPTLLVHDGSAIRVSASRGRPRCDRRAGTAGCRRGRSATAVVEPAPGGAADDRPPAERHRVHRATCRLDDARSSPRATVVGGHDGRAEIEVEFTYDNGGTSTISLDEEACTRLARRAPESARSTSWLDSRGASCSRHSNSQQQENDTCSISSSVTD